jgi:hypothetical protein
MKYIISTFIVSALVAMSFTLNDRLEFSEFFKMAFDKSYSGLENMKDAKTGTWEFERAIGDFDICQIRYDMQRGVHGVRFVRNVEDESTGEQFINRFEQQVMNVLPEGKYAKNDLESVNGKHVYEFNSLDMAEKAKNPVVEFSVERVGNRCEMIITLFEPFNRQQPLKK